MLLYKGGLTHAVSISLWEQRRSDSLSKIYSFDSSVSVVQVPSTMQGPI